MLLTRRRLILITAAAVASGWNGRLLPMPAVAQTVPRDATFDVLRGKDRIGQHAVAFRPEGAGFRAVTNVELRVKMAFITLLDLRHQSEELWHDGRLVEMRSTTRDGSDQFEAAAETVPDGLRCHSPAGTVVAPPELYTSNSIWDVAAMRRDQLIDAQTGGVIGLVSESAGEEQVDVAGKAMPANRYRVVTPIAAGDLWYADAEFVKGRLEIRGEIIDYVRVA